jgi:hypothetical protein
MDDGTPIATLALIRMTTAVVQEPTSAKEMTREKSILCCAENQTDADDTVGRRSPASQRRFYCLANLESWLLPPTRSPAIRTAGKMPFS